MGQDGFYRHVQNIQGLFRDAKDQLKEKYLLVNTGIHW